MIKQYLLILCITYCLFLGCSSNLTNNISLKSTLEDVMDSANIPALSISIIDNNKIVYDYSLGIKDTKSNEPIDNSTIFEAASLTKPITVYCAMRLVAEGKLDLDTPLFEYLEYEPINYDERYKLITSRMVMSHTSGFPNWRRFNKDGKLDIKFTPGERYSYSGEGIVYLQRVIEKLWDKPLDSIINDMVFTPLNMSNSYMTFPSSSNYAIGHDMDKNPQEKFQPNIPNGAATLHTTAYDYSKFLQELIEPQYTDKAIIAKMLSPQVSISKEDSTLFFGLGIALQIRDSDTLFWHWGSNEYFRAFFIVSKSNKKGFVYFTNSAMGLSIINRMIEIVFADTSILSKWNQYPQYTHPFFILNKAYKDYGLDSLLVKFKYGKENQPNLYDDESILNYFGKLAVEKGDIKDALEMYQLNLNEYPDNKEAKEMIIKIKKDIE